MSGMMMSAMNNIVPYNPNPNTWTGTTTGLQLNLLNAPLSGTTWVDATGNGNNGTVRKLGTGTATYTSSKNGGLTFANDINTNTAMVSTGYNLTVPFTIEVIANITALSQWATLWGNENYNSGTGWFAYWSNSAAFYISSASTTRANLYSGITCNLGSIRQFICVVDNTPSASFYINGTLQSPAAAGYTIAPSAASNGLNFGSRHPNAGTSNTPNDCAIGTYYQMRAYNIALNQSQVTANYNAVKTLYGI